MRIGRQIRQVAVAAVLGGVLCAVGPAPAWAHDTLVESVPAVGSAVDAQPRTVTLRMSGDVVRASVRVTDGCGRPVPATVAVAGPRVNVRLSDTRPTATAHEHSGTGGSWLVDWQVVGADGHPVTGEVPFSVSGPADCEELPQPSSSAAPAGAGAGTGGASAGTAGSRSGGDVHQAAPAGVSSTSDGLPILPLAAVAGVLTLLVGVQLVRRRAGG